MKLSLKYKLLISFMAVVIIVLTIVAAGGSVLIRQYFIKNKQQELTAKAYELAGIVSGYYDGEITYDQLKNFVNSADSFLDTRVWVVDDRLNIIAVSEESPAGHHYGGMKRHWSMCMGMGTEGMGGMGGMRRHNRNLPIQQQPDVASLQEKAGGSKSKSQLVLDLGQGKGVSLEDIQGMKELNQNILNNYGKPWTATYYHPYYEENMIIAAVPLKRTSNSNANLGTIMVNAPLAKIDGFLYQIYYYIALAGLAGVIFAIFLAGYLSGGIVRPLKAMQKTASAMAQGDYSARVNISASGEVGDLGRSLNSLAKDLESYVSKMKKTDIMRRDFVANVSHELRTPLTIMRGYNQALEDGAITGDGEIKYRRAMGEEIARLEKLISELLDLSQLEADSYILELESIDLKEIINNVMILLEQRSRECGINITANIPEDVLPVTGDGNRLTQLVLIIMDNALKFTPPGGKVQITLSRENNWVELTISDTGAGIEPEDLPYIWERFYKTGRPQSKGNGKGLGLAIAKQILDLHQAAAEVSSAPGKGTTFKIKFNILLTNLL